MHRFNLAASLCDPVVLQDMLDFNARARLTSSMEVFPHLRSPGLHFPAYSRLENEEFPLSAVGGLQIDVQGSRRFEALTRAGSCRAFCATPIARRDLDDLVANALLARNTLGQRNYPSGGGLYPVEVFLAPLYQNALEGLEHAVYHVLAKSRRLEWIKDLGGVDLAPILQRDGFDRIGRPALAIFYATHLERVIPKYRYRGFRHALIEVGAIIQQVDLVAGAIDLGSIPWSWFDDYEMSRLLGLNPRRLPLMAAQLVGHRAAQDAAPSIRVAVD